MINKKYIFAFIIILIVFIVIYYAYLSFDYKQILFKAKKTHQNTSEQVFDLKLAEERLKQQKENLNNQSYEDPDREDLLKFLNGIKDKK